MKKNNSLENLLKNEVQEYIKANLTEDLPHLLLKKSPFPEISMSEIAKQIKGRNVAAKKFPFLLKEGIVFPPHLNLEQASSQATAEYKAHLVKGNSFLDLTTGFGIDAYFFSNNFETITLVEKNAQLLAMVQHNWRVLGKKANFIEQNLDDFLAENQNKYEVVYLDPARRGQNQNKVFLLEDLSPNFLEIQEKLSKISQEVLIKFSPLIDLSYLISAIKNIKEIHIVAVKNEVKEILVHLSSHQKVEQITIHCVNLQTQEPAFIFPWKEKTATQIQFSEPLDFIYIPNNSLLKSGAFSEIAEEFGLKKLHPNTHLFTSQKEILDFPGRVLKMKIIDSKEIKKGEQYNIISKNYPLKPEQIKAKYKIKDGTDRYLIFSQTKMGKIILKSE